MTREQALAIADKRLLSLIASGDAEIFAAAGNDPVKVAVAGMRARERLADKIMAEAGAATSQGGTAA